MDKIRTNPILASVANQVEQTEIRSPPRPQQVDEMGLSFEKLATDDVPSLALLRPLIESYFDHVHCLYPFLHRPSFEAQYLELTQDSSNKSIEMSVVYMLVALGYVFYAGGKGLQTSRVFVDKAKSYLRFQMLDTPTLEFAQVLLLLTQYYIEECLNRRGFLPNALTHLSMAINVCRILGFHKPTSPNPIYQQLALRAWWGCVYFDTVLSVYFGQPALIYDRSFDMDYPACLDDYCITNHTIHFQLSSTPSITTFFVKSVELYQILSDMSKALYSGASIKSDDAGMTCLRRGDFSMILEYETKLKDWYVQLPAYLKSDGIASFPFADARIRRQCDLLRLKLCLVLRRLMVDIFIAFVCFTDPDCYCSWTRNNNLTARRMSRERR